MKNQGVVSKGIFALATVLVVLSLQAPAQAKQREGNSGVIRLEETIIEGRVQKPNAFFIATRQALVFELLEIKESFVGEIKKAVKKGPF
jgi:hypothetical protein